MSPLATIIRWQLQVCADGLLARMPTAVHAQQCSGWRDVHLTCAPLPFDVILPAPYALCATACVPPVRSTAFPCCRGPWHGRRCPLLRGGHRCHCQHPLQRMAHCMPLAAMSTAGAPYPATFWVFPHAGRWDGSGCPLWGVQSPLLTVSSWGLQCRVMRDCT